MFMRIRFMAVGVIVLGAVTVSAQDWPQWRGPNRDGQVKGFTAPKSWPKEATQRWTTMIGSGVSSPVMVGNKLYTFGRIGGDEVTTCLDAVKGEQVWQDRYSTDAVGGAAQGYGGPRSTPCTSGGKIFTFGVNGTVSCLDAVSGKFLWRKETGEKPQFATSSSPLVVDNKLIVFAGALTAFDVKNGDVKWTGPKGTPYGSPVLMTVSGVRTIVTPTLNQLVGVNAADGKELWQVSLPKGKYQVNYNTPIIDGQTVIFGSPGMGAGSSMALKIEKMGDKFTATEQWKSTAAYQYNTPVLKGGLLFGLSGDKKFFCMEAKSGKVLWTDTTPRGEAGGVLSAGNVVLALVGPVKGGRSETAKGKSELVAFEASKAGFKELAKYELSPAAGLAYPVIAGNWIYVKGNDNLTAWSID